MEDEGVQAEDYTGEGHPNDGDPGDGFRQTAEVKWSRLEEVGKTNGSVDEDSKMNGS